MLQIRHIERLNHLTELRVLNLAGNRIEFVDNLQGMNALTELNLRRNQIRSVVSIFIYSNFSLIQSSIIQFYLLICTQINAKWEQMSKFLLRFIQ